jgi:hypothetical protein
MTTEANTPDTPAAQTTTPPATPPSGGQETTPAQPPANTVKPRDTKALDAAVRRTVVLKQREQELAKRADDLKPLQEIAELAKTNPAAAFKRLAGDGLLDAYKSITEDVVGLNDETKALEALPRSVREQLAKMKDLEEKAAKVGDLQARLDALEKSREEARQQFASQQRTAVAERTYSSGYKAVEDAAAELPLVARHPRGGELVQAEWVAVLEDKRADLAGVQGPEREALAAGFVLEAARRVQSRLTEELSWALPSSPEGVKVAPTSAAPSGKATPAPKTAPSTLGQTRTVPRTGTPGSLGEPSGTDTRKLTTQQRLNLLRDEERAGKFYSR